MISVTGKFVFSILLALSQYVVPYSEEQKEQIRGNYENAGLELEDWQERALEFEPKNIYELIAITSDERAIAQYIRTSCIRIMSSTQSQRNIDRGVFETMDFELLRALVSDEQIQEFQARVRSSEQDIRIENALDYMQRACDLKHSVESIEKIAFFEEDRVPFDPSALNTMSIDQIVASIPYEGAMREVVEYYGSVYYELPQIESKDDLPYLPELSLVFDSNGQIIGDYSLTEYSREYQAIVRRNRRVLTRDSSDIPDQLKNALVSVEDSNFYEHLGVDLRGALRAAQSTSSGDSVQGASTITMQLAKNLLLYEEVFAESVEGRRSLIRKLQEYILVKKLEEVLTKDEILELYFNTIDFGRGVQGIVLAAKVYFGKELAELELKEMAFLAGLPKAPYGLDPTTNPDGAFERRNRVLRDMLREQYITREDFVELTAQPLETLPANSDERADGYSMHYVNAVQKQIQDWARALGQNSYVGLEVTTPINHEYQRWAVETLQRGLLAYERRRTRNGKKVLTVKPDEDQLPNIRELVEELAETRGQSTTEVFAEILEPIEHRYPDTSQFSLGVILSNEKIGLKDGTQVNRQPEDRAEQLYKVVDGRKQNLEVWDVVMLEPFLRSDGGTFYKIASYTDVQGGVVVIDNQTGAVLATSGGFSVGAGGRYKGAGGNRAFNNDPLSMQPPGSTIKPFTYLYALNNGVLPSQSVSNNTVRLPRIRRDNRTLCDAKTWSYSGGPMAYSLFDGLVNSKNEVTLNAFVKASGVQEWEDTMFAQRNLEQGLFELANTFETFGIYRNLETFCYPVILGGDGVRVADMAGAYATIARGGGHVEPYTASRLKLSRNDRTLDYPLSRLYGTQDAVTEAVVQDPVNLFRLTQMLQGVVQRGTARSMSEWSNIIAGKTGTVEVCNGGCKNTDTWFVGFNKEITVAVWVGYPENENLGGGNQGSNVALPIFKDFMEQYYNAYPEKESIELIDSIPQNLLSVYIEGTTGFLIDDDFRNAFAYYTGRGFNYLDRLGSTVYVTEDERRQISRYFRSEQAMSFFYDQLTTERKAQLRENYLSRFGGGQRSVYDDYQYNLQLCEPYLVSNGRGGRTWNSRNVPRNVDQACRYVASFGANPPQPPAESQANDQQLRQYFIENYY